MSERGEAPTTAIERGAKSGRRSMAGRARGAGRPGRTPAALDVRDAIPAHPTTRPTPRFSSARAMIQALDLADVPSQIRSTRSSRKNRSAGVLAHVAAAAEHLDDPVRAAEGRLGREQLRQRRLGVDDLRVGPAVGQPGALAGQQAGRRRVGRGVGEREADPLEVVDPLAELDALGGPLDGQRRAAAPSPRCSGRRCGSAPRRTTRWSARRRRRSRRGSPAGTRTSSSTNWGCRSANVWV